MFQSLGLRPLLLVLPRMLQSGVSGHTSLTLLSWGQRLLLRDVHWMFLSGAFGLSSPVVPVLVVVAAPSCSDPDDPVRESGHILRMIQSAGGGCGCVMRTGFFNPGQHAKVPRKIGSWGLWPLLLALPQLIQSGVSVTVPKLLLSWGVWLSPLFRGLPWMIQSGALATVPRRIQSAGLWPLFLALPQMIQSGASGHICRIL